jgi:Mg2+-importing ATPase
VEGVKSIGILTVSSLLSYLQELRAHTAVIELLKKLGHRANMKRDGGWIELPISEIAPGDVVPLSAGVQLPADCRLMEAKGLLVGFARSSD